ncbi:unnamed protein product [Aphanomyces euteiches]|uniref:Protein transport protein sec16 n=1 Tax=Aphanomyces euteiches TaxID=100861 RepID=A0A6G0XHN3_9STRA|nr:hypothetical protein Ae201684_004662 [Aphanomyces euteiches]KAH9073351.1 hypothetical protein Ae201684P_015163 [Aphanomyces euteiches]
MSSEGQGVRTTYGPPSNTESEGWEVVEQYDRSTNSQGSPSQRRHLSINPHAETTTRNKMHLPTRKNAIPSQVVDDLLSERHITERHTETLDLYADDGEIGGGGAWGTDSPSNLLGNDDELDYEEKPSTNDAPATPKALPTWTHNVDLSPRSPPAGAFGDDDLDLDDEEDEVSHPPPSSLFNITASPLSDNVHAPEGAFGDDDLDLDDDDDILDESHESVYAPVASSVHSDYQSSHTGQTLVQPEVPVSVEQHIPELHSIPLSPTDAPAGAFGDDDLDLDDDEPSAPESTTFTSDDASVSRSFEGDVHQVDAIHQEPEVSHSHQIDSTLTEITPQEIHDEQPVLNQPCDIPETIHDGPSILASSESDSPEFATNDITQAPELSESHGGPEVHAEPPFNTHPETPFDTHADTHEPERLFAQPATDEIPVDEQTETTYVEDSSSFDTPSQTYQVHATPETSFDGVSPPGPFDTQAHHEAFSTADSLFTSADTYERPFSVEASFHTPQEATPFPTETLELSEAPHESKHDNFDAYRQEAHLDELNYGQTIEASTTSSEFFQSHESIPEINSPGPFDQSYQSQDVDFPGQDMTRRSDDYPSYSSGPTELSTPEGPQGDTPHVDEYQSQHSSPDFQAPSGYQLEAEVTHQVVSDYQPSVSQSPFSHSPEQHSDFSQHFQKVHHETPEDHTPQSADGLFGSSSNEYGFGAPDEAQSSPPRAQSDVYGAYENPASADSLFSSAPSNYGQDMSGFNSVPPPPASSSDALFSSANYHTAPQPASVDDFFSNSSPFDVSSQFHSSDHAADLFSGSNEQDPFASRHFEVNSTQRSADQLFGHGHNDFSPAHQYDAQHAPSGQDGPTSSGPFGDSHLSNDLYSQGHQTFAPEYHAPQQSLHGSESYFQQSHDPFGAPAVSDSRHDVPEYHSTPGGNFHSEPGYTHSSHEHYESDFTQYHSAPAYGSESSPFDEPAFDQAGLSVPEHHSNPDDDRQSHPVATANTLGAGSNETAPHLASTVDPPTHLHSEQHTSSGDAVSSQQTTHEQSSKSVTSTSFEHFSPEEHSEAPHPFSAHHSSDSHFPGFDGSHASSASTLNTSANIPEYSEAPSATSVHASAFQHPPTNVVEETKKSRPTIKIEDEDVPTADSLFSPTNGNELSNVFGTNSSFDQPPSSLGGFSRSVTGAASAFFGSGNDQHGYTSAPTQEPQFSQQSSTPFDVGNADGPTTPVIQAATEESQNTQDPFSQPAAPSNQFGSSASELFGESTPFDQSVDPFGQPPAEYHNPASYGYAHQDSQYYNQPSAASFDQSSGTGYGEVHHTGYSQHGYESYDKTVNQGYNQVQNSPAYTAFSQQAETYAHPTLDRSLSSASSHFEGSAQSQGYTQTNAYHGQQHATGYSDNYSQAGTNQLGYNPSGYNQAALNRPAYSQPVAQTFDQPAVPSYPQTPVQGYSHISSGYASQPYGQTYNQQYNQQAYTQSSYNQEAYGQPTAQGYSNASVDARPKPSIFKPQAAPSTPVSYEQHAPRMSRELKQQYQPATSSHPTPAVFNPAPKPQVNDRPKDPSVLPRSCLATFGFGGNLCVMFPRRKLKLLNTAPRNSPRQIHGSQSFEEHIDDSRKGPLDFYKLDQLHHPNDVFYQKVKSFPGPLTPQVSDDAISKYMTAQVSPASHEDERLLWELMQVFLKSKGKISTRDAQVPDILLMQVLQNSLARRTNLPPYDTPAAAPSLHESQLDANTTKLRQLLLDGDRKGAIEVTTAANLWPQAMLIASFVDPELYKSVVQSFISSRYGVGDPLRTLFMVFGDLETKSLHEPVPLMETRAPKPSALLSNWLSQVQILVANPTKDTNRVLVELGDRLMRETNNIWAAHVCFLLSGVPIEAPSPTTRMTLIGGHAIGDVRFFVRPNTIQWTEVYERVMQQTPLIAFQGYKFIYATLLADAGCSELAFKYVDSMRKIMDQWINKQKIQSPYLDNLRTQLDVFDDRLRYYMGQDRVEAAEVQVNKRSIFGTLTGIFDKALDKIVNDTPMPTKTQSAPVAGTAFDPRMFPPAPGSNHSSQAPGSQTGYPPESRNSNFASSAPGSQNSGFIGSAPNSQTASFIPAPPGSQNAYAPNNATFSSGPPSSHGGQLADAPLPPRPQTAAPRSEPPSIAPHHAPLKKSTSFTEKSKEEPKPNDPSPAKEKAKAKTPPTSQKKSGWLPSLSLPDFGIVEFIRDKVDPVGDAKKAHEGKQMEAYYCEKTKRWIFPGEESADEPPPPSAPPTSFPAPAAPASASQAADNDPLAALMAPPPVKEVSAINSMMAPPPPRSLYGSQRGGSTVKKAPPRPQFTVFKPNPTASAAAAPVEASTENDSPPPPPSNEGQ